MSRCQHEVSDMDPRFGILPTGLKAGIRRWARILHGSRVEPCFIFRSNTCASFALAAVCDPEVPFRDYVLADLILTFATTTFMIVRRLEKSGRG